MANASSQHPDDSRQAQNRKARAARCPACQLQICKARDAGPHEKLIEADRTLMQGGDRAYTCQTCSITLVNSRDPGKPGWTHARAT